MSLLILKIAHKHKSMGYLTNQILIQLIVALSLISLFAMDINN